jgi:hypothetical protein
MRQLREGSDDFNRRDWQNIRHLRVACFGCWTSRCCSPMA